MGDTRSGTARNGASSPLATGRARRPTTISTMDSRQLRVEPGLVERLFIQGQAACKAGNYNQAEDKWKQALQVDQNDTRTLLHYAVMLRDKISANTKDDAEKLSLQSRAEQLINQAMGESNVYVSIGLTSPGI